MLGLDTNVLVRYLVRDDEVQFEKARKLIKREVAAGRGVFVSHLVVLETEWVLRSRYGLRAELIPSSGGVFEVTVDGDLVFSKKALDRFPDHEEIFREVDRRR